jgi:predicted RNase H-like HicB family nuclease
VNTYSASLVWSDEDSAYVATSTEFPGLSGVSERGEEALAELSEAIQMAIEAMAAEHHPLPEPRRLAEYSGQIRLRMPTTLHRLAVERAESEGVSLNTILINLISFGLGQRMAEGKVAVALGAVLGELRSAVLGFIPHALSTSGNRTVGERPPRNRSNTISSVQQ